MGDLLDIESLFPQLVLALGAALLAGNGLAIINDRRNKQPADRAGPLRKGRAWFLAVTGLVMAVWGLASLLT